MFNQGREGPLWQNLRQMLEVLLQRCRSSAESRRVDKERARFWDELREGELEGEREAEARSGP